MPAHYQTVSPLTGCLTWRTEPGHWIRDPRFDNAETAAMVRAIISGIARRHGSTVTEILGHQRDKIIVRARWAAIGAVALAYPEASLKQLGAWFHRHHASIVHALRELGIVHQGCKPPGAQAPPPLFPRLPYAQRQSAAVRPIQERAAA